MCVVLLIPPYYFPCNRALTFFIYFYFFQGAIRQALVRLIHIQCPNFKSHLHGAWVTRRNKHGHIGGGRNYF